MKANTLSTSPRTALVTGGNRGIGFGIATALACEGWRVVIAATRDEEACAEPLDALRQHAEDRVAYVKLDVSDAASREACVTNVVEKFGGIDLLVNNAGVAPLERLDLLETTPESYSRVMRINLEGPFFLTQQVARTMVARRKRGDATPMTIVNVSSISATVASVQRGEYCISKAGVSMATRLWATRLASERIAVFEVRPGIIATDMTATVREKYDKLIAEGLVPQQRWGTAADVGTAVAMLARGDLAYSTGQIITVDGGMTLERL
ncbi:MAG: 3-ketoacyl-ACP reductase [Thermoguttaceae bacterium]